MGVIDECKVMDHGKVPEKIDPCNVPGLCEHTIQLKKAIKGDFLEVERINPAGKKVWKLIYGMPYWMINSKGIIENKNYRTTEATNLKSFGEYLKNEQIFITY